MNTQFSSKFAALALALAVNVAMIGAVTVLFSGRIEAQTAALAQAHAVIGQFV